METTDRVWTEHVFIKHNPAALHKNPLAYQNKLMIDYFNKQILPSVLDDITFLKENNTPSEFELVVMSKYERTPDKEPENPFSELDAGFDPHLEDFDELPTPIRFLKFYYSKVPSTFTETMCKYILSYKDQSLIPPPIAFMLGIIHDIGLTVPVDHKLAFKYYLEAKKGKYPYAYYTLFDIYARCFDTYGVERNHTTALKYIVKLMLYSIYCSDSWISPSFVGDGAFGYLSIAYAHLDISAYACQYAQKIATSSKSLVKRKIMQYILTVGKKEMEEQLKALEELSKECDDPFLLVKIADIHLIGSGPTAKNQERAREFLIKLLNSTSNSPFRYYGYELLGYLYDAKGEYKDALKCYRVGAQYGLIYSMKKVGTAHALGLTIEPDFKLAESLLVQAAALGSNDAYLSLLELYIYLSELKGKAWEFYISVLPLVPMFSFFEQDCYQLYKAMMMEKGMGVEKNYPSAITIYSTLPKKDFPVALYRLGKVYLRSDNIIQAQQYFEDCYHNYTNITKNWLQPHASTYIRIAKLYLLGQGCDKNLLRAEEILDKAVNLKCCSTIPCLIRKKKAKVILERLRGNGETENAGRKDKKTTSKEEMKDTTKEENTIFA